MPDIVVIDPSNVTIDGVPAGSVFDVPENHANVDGIRSLVLNALLVWRDECDRCHGEHCKSLQESHAADLAAARQETSDARVAAQAVLADRDAKHAAAIADRDARAMQLQSTITKQQTLIDALGGTELGKKLATEAACKAARDQIAAWQSVLDAHSESETTVGE